MTRVIFSVLDTETTGLVAPEAECIEVAVTLVSFDTDSKVAEIGDTASGLFYPERGIPPEASAVHHLTMKDVLGTPVCTPDHLIRAISEGTFLVCHNLAFDGQFFGDQMPEHIHKICTLKCAKRIWPEAPGHSNGVLRYWLELDIDQSRAMPPHRAGADSYVTAAILCRMLQTERVADLVRWTLMPTYYPTCPLAKWKGRAWGDIDASYLKWMIGPNDLDADLKAAAQDELNLRAAG